MGISSVVYGAHLEAMQREGLRFMSSADDYLNKNLKLKTMKLNKTQLDQFESLLKSQGYKRDHSYKGEFLYWKSIVKEDQFKVYIQLTFYDFNKYSTYMPKEFPYSFEPAIVIVNNSLSTRLNIPFLYDGKPLFVDYNSESKDNNHFIIKECKVSEVMRYLETLKNIALKFKDFYLQNIGDYINKE